MLLKSLATLCFIEAYHSNNTMQIRKKFSKEGIRYCRDALKYNKSAEIYNLLGDFYYMNLEKSDDNDKLAKDAYLKVIEIDTKDFNANYRLAGLYFRHKNNEKALYYIRKAVNRDPSNEEARELLKKLE